MTRPSSSDDIRIRLPQSWQQLTDRQLHIVARCMTAARRPDTALLLTFLRLSGIGIVPASPRIVRTVLRGRRDIMLIRRRGRVHRILRRDIALAAMRLDFLLQPPAVPLRPRRICAARTIDAALHGLPFGDYLRLDNYFRRYLAAAPAAAQSPLLTPMADILTDGRRRRRPTACDAYLITLWLASLQSYFAGIFSDLLRPAPAASGDDDDGDAAHDSPDSMRRRMVTMIRALTGGDVTREAEVLRVDTWTALTELNEKAREARETERICRKK